MDELETTARNLTLIQEARIKRREPIAWAKEVEEALFRSYHLVMDENENNLTRSCIAPLAMDTR